FWQNNSRSVTLSFGLTRVTRSLDIPPALGIIRITVKTHPGLRAGRLPREPADGASRRTQRRFPPRGPALRRPVASAGACFQRGCKEDGVGPLSPK
ncbi:MAG: hypothetical protein ACPLUL_14365, partial [Thermanaerothrix sp.]|uniref:hypothetical protein n=1 Tax=Thermanaerothrix sp. TaxID=2972675 RepID=UPI003C7D9F36